MDDGHLDEKNAAVRLLEDTLVPVPAASLEVWAVDVTTLLKLGRISGVLQTVLNDYYTHLIEKKQNTLNLRKHFHIIMMLVKKIDFKNVLCRAGGESEQIDSDFHLTRIRLGDYFDVTNSHLMF